jgi:hypothetical protein
VKTLWLPRVCRVIRFALALGVVVLAAPRAVSAQSAALSVTARVINECTVSVAERLREIDGIRSEDHDNEGDIVVACAHRPNMFVRLTPEGNPSIAQRRIPDDSDTLLVYEIYEEVEPASLSGPCGLDGFDSSTRSNTAPVMVNASGRARVAQRYPAGVGSDAVIASVEF